MSASITYVPDPVPVARQSDIISVYRYFPKGTSFDTRFELCDWVVCLGITSHEGANPGSARFRYKLPDDPTAPDAEGVPIRFEDAFPLDAVGPKVINNDDRLVVRRTTDDGSSQYLFDGFVQVPQADLGPETETVSFSALGAPVREWDTPLAGAIVRAAIRPLAVNYDEGTTTSRQVDLPARFNPDGEPNASPIDETVDPPVGDSGKDPAKYPVFLGPVSPQNKINGHVIRMWTLAMAARYIIVTGAIDPDSKLDGKIGNKAPSKYVTYDDLAYLDTLLTAWAPSGGSGDPVSMALAALKAAKNDPNASGDDIAQAEEIYDAAWKEADAGQMDEDAGSFTTEDIEAPDLIVTGMAWPAALERLLLPYGFSFRFELEEAQSQEFGGVVGDGKWPDGQFGEPTWTLKVYWKDSDRNAKTLMLQKAGEALDPARTNVSELSLARDSAGVANQIVIDAAPVRVEVPLLLAPGFKIDPADADNTKKFELGGLTGDDRDKYRLWIYDECGEGHWNQKGFAEGSSTPGYWDVGNAGGIAEVLFTGLAPAPKPKGGTTLPGVPRRRVPIDKLISVDDKGDPLRATLFVFFDYPNDLPDFWEGDSAGTWQEVVSGEWRLCDDRLGVYFTAADINSMAVGSLPDPGGTPNPLMALRQFKPQPQLDKKCINMVEWTARPTAGNPYPRFMLLCCVDLDNDFDVTAPKRKSSTTDFTVTRRVDARDRFKKTVVSKWSFFGDLVNDFGKTDRVVTDDQAEAQALADAERRHSESATFAGSATIPRLSMAYRLGDKVRSIDGRKVSLRSNLGAEQSESPIYPTVVSVSWNFDGGQQTSLTLEDRRAEPPPRRGRRRDEKPH